MTYNDLPPPIQKAADIYWISLGWPNGMADTFDDFKTIDLSIDEWYKYIGNVETYDQSKQSYVNKGYLLTPEVMAAFDSIRWLEPPYHQET